MELEYAFFNLLRDYYDQNKGKVKRRYTDLTRKFLNYNDKEVNPDAFLRRPQFEALEMYVFIKEFFNNRDVAAIFKDYMEHKGEFADESFYAHPIYKSGQTTLLDIGAKQNEALFKEMKKVSEAYPNYIYALTMGLGKTVLMATCIFYEFLVANKNPKDGRFCHNAIVFAPDKTVLESLREIITLDKTLVVPPEYARVLDANIKVHFLEDTGTTLNTLDNSDFNIIISNTQKIIVKKKHKDDSAAVKLFTQTKSPDQLSIIDAALQDIYGDDDITADDLIFNQRFKKLCRLNQIGIYVDEAHHLFGKELEKALRKGTDTSLRNTINLLATELERGDTSVVACYNYTGTPYVKNKILPEVVYSYGLKNAIAMGYLKDVDLLKGYENVKDKEFLKDVLEIFWTTHKGKTYEGLPPKIAIFASRIAEITDEVQPAVEEICDELGIPRDKILVNVGDAAITKDEAIRDFNNLDVIGTAGSQKQIILLVDKGREGWNCRSLFSVAMFRSPKSKVFVLQATMRCLRQITDEQQKAMVFLSKDNLDILDGELQENFDMTVDDLSNKGKSDRETYEVRVLPPPRYIKVKTVHHNYTLTEKEYTAPVDFGLAEYDYTKYAATVYEKRGLAADTALKEHNADYLRETRKFSGFTLIGEIARYLNAKCTVISRVLKECVDGEELVLEKVNLYNDVLYDIIIPKIFSTLWDEKVEKIVKERQLILLRKPTDKEYYTFSASPELVIKRDDVEMARYKERSFHADTYCFDSKPEKECFYQYIMNENRVKSVYFTGMFTAGQGDLSIPYYDPETKRMRNYYPDFLAEMADGTIQLIEVKGDNKIDDVVVKAKASAAKEIASESEMEYIIYAGSKLMNENVLEDDDPQSHLV
ncbi:MAG: DEAD/DEAH box helicase family protein [Bacteroides sp.]|nr:DEAD/DEAH box helicase family protein [Bacteroides sp.]